jgi:hypothetical protein
MGLQFLGLACLSAIAAAALFNFLTSRKVDAGMSELSNPRVVCEEGTLPPLFVILNSLGVRSYSH